MASTVNSASAFRMALFEQFTLSESALKKSGESLFAFAARTEHKNRVEGGVYSLAGDRKRTDVAHSFARVVEKFR